MIKISAFEKFYIQIKENRWYWLFSVFCRFSLAYAFTVAGMVKITGERFASGLAIHHPMGAYLEALHHTGYYYTFIGIAQILAAILLIIPRTVTLGALLYLPIIVNIWVLSYAVRFEGSMVTAPLMVLANLFLLIWNYDRLRYLLPIHCFAPLGIFEKPTKYSTKFPLLFATMVLVVIGLVIAIAQFGFGVVPRNSLSDCKAQFINTIHTKAGSDFCECIHLQGTDLDSCLDAFETAKDNL